MKTKISIFLAVNTIVCGQIFSQATGNLKKTVKRFTSAIADINKEQSQYQKNVSQYIDPGANVDSLTADYYLYWKKNNDMQSYPLKTKIRSIR